MKVRDLKGKIIWITGASSGIGEALALEFARYETRLILSGRRKEEIDRVAQQCLKMGSEATPVIFDLGIPAEVENAAAYVLDKFNAVDILILNGGISQRSLLLDTPVEIDRKVMEIDFFSGVILTKKMIHPMVKSGSGHLVVISSITGVFGFPLRSAYAAAKHALMGFYGSLWAELSPAGIDVTLVCPGRINTNVSLNAITEKGIPYSVMDHDIHKGISPEKCAQIIVKAVLKKKKMIYIARKEILMVYFKKFFPWLFYKLVTKVKPA
jgi:dehydrogenase/reductase SDR family member 7B